MHDYEPFPHRQQRHADDPRIPENLRWRNMRDDSEGSPYFVITRVSEAGTSDTSRLVLPTENAFTGVMCASVTVDRLRRCTSARIDGLPALKDLGIMRIRDVSVSSGHVLYCWLYTDEDPEARPEMYTLRSFNARKPAEDHAQSEQCVNTLVPGASLASTVICLRDVIVKIIDAHVYTKTKKTYYTLSQNPLPHTNALAELGELAELPGALRARATRIAIARCIYGVHMKPGAWLGAYYDVGGEMHVASINHGPIFGSKTARIPETLTPLSREDRTWLRGLARDQHIVENTHARTRLDQLITELT
jgi:hypothetical protein